jgi:hypothetical protein
MVRPGRDGCKVQLRSAWRREVLAEATAPGAGAESVGTALSALLGQGVPRLPRRARLFVPDERAYFTLLPATPAWHTAQARATAHFTNTLGRQDLMVRVSALHGGRWWLAAAIENADVAAWQQALSASGVTLAAIELALLHDLRAISRHVPDRSIVAMLRDEGVTLVRVHRGAPVELVWERCDPHAQQCLEQRMLAFAQHPVDGLRPEPLVLLCRSMAQHDQWQRLAKAHRWTLLTPRAPKPLLEGAPA